MASSAVVQRFRECQNLLVSIVENLRAMENLTTQRVVVEEALRRYGPSVVDTLNDDTPPFAYPLYGADTLLCCCTAPLGVLRSFPDAIAESIIAQHMEDTNALLRSLSSAQQMWQTKLQRAKEALTPSTPSHAQASPCVGEDAGGVFGAHALLAVLARMHAWLQELVLALRADLSRPPRAVQLATLLNGHARGGEKRTVGIGALGEALAQLPEWVQREWDNCRAQYMVDEAWILLA